MNTPSQEGGDMVNTMTDVAKDAPPGALPTGTRVDVRSRYVGAWSHGFEVAEALGDGYRVKRLSDDTVLPDVFSADDIRPEHRKQGMWWY
jgi:hypothetical protein